jgi:hypothetical protein
MPANIYPVFSRTWDIQLAAAAVIGPNANTATDGTGANTSVIFQADTTEGGFVYKVVFKPIASPAATVIRLFYCSATGAFTAGTTNTAANTSLLSELSTVAWTASNTAASPQYEIPVMMGLPPGTRLLATFGTSTGAAGNGFNPLVIAGKY